MTAEELKELLSTPLMLFVMMLVASLTSALIEVGKAKKAGIDASFADYLAHWPSTVGALLGNIIAFAVLVMTDQLNFAAALGIGYGVNNVVDMLPKNDRASLLGNTKQEGFARIGVLVMLTFAGLLALSACTTNPVSPAKLACSTNSAYQVERCAKSIAETFEVYQQRAYELATDPSTPEEVKELVRKADAVTTPVIVESLRATKAYMQIRDEVAAGTTPSERLAIAEQNVRTYGRIAEERLTAFLRALQGEETPGLVELGHASIAPATASVSVSN